MADWEIYADELRDDNELLCLPQSPLYREIHRENQRAQKRQEHGIGVVHHQVDAPIMEPGSDR